MRSSPLFALLAGALATCMPVLVCGQSTYAQQPSSADVPPSKRCAYSMLPGLAGFVHKGDYVPKDLWLANNQTGKTCLYFCIDKTGRPRVTLGGSGVPKGLSELTIEDSYSIFGKGIQKDDFYTFSLAGAGDESSKTYAVDFRFKDGHIQEYRVHGPLVSDNNWQSAL